MNKTWQEIEEELKNKAYNMSLWYDVMPKSLLSRKYSVYQACLDMIYLFKPYFQEKLHEEAKEELEINYNSLIGCPAFFDQNGYLNISSKSRVVEEPLACTTAYESHVLVRVIAFKNNKIIYGTSKLVSETDIKFVKVI